MKSKIRLGYEITSGKEIAIPISHLLVTGVTQLSGKTTTLEALLSRSHTTAIVFKTKIGEKSFAQGAIIPPFFRPRSDYEFVRSLIEAYAKERLFLEKGRLMELCKGAINLEAIRDKVTEAMANPKLRGIDKEINTRLEHYLNNLIPQIQNANLSSTLQAAPGINIMNLDQFSEEVQSLIIEAVAGEVLKNRKNYIIVIPEAWKFLPQKGSNPCKHAVESFIRQGAANNNFVWIDSQDMAGVDKTPLKQISTWLLGYQSERNEVKHTLDQIPLPNSAKPPLQEIMNLQIGQFIAVTREGVCKVYIQPTWLSEQDAKGIAQGKKPIPRLNRDKGVDDPLDIPQLGKSSEAFFFMKMLTELRQWVERELQNLKDNQPTDQLDMEVLAKKVAALLPATTGQPVYQLAPVDMIRRNFLEEIKQKIVKDVSGLKDDEKKVLLYIETNEADVTNSEVVTKCLLLKNGGSSAVKVSNIFKALHSIEAIEKAPKQKIGKGLHKRITSLMEGHKATPEEIEATYNRILFEILNKSHAKTSL